MVSCLMGDSTALASAIVRCCLKSSFLSFIKNNTTEKRCVFSFIYSIGFTGFLQNEFMQHKAHFGLRAVQTALPCKTVR